MSKNKKNKRPEFVDFETTSSETFKYKLATTRRKYINISLAKIKQKTSLLTEKVDLTQLTKDLTLWMLEAFIEGFVINFIVWALLGWKFTFLTMSAWGFATKQVLSMYWRLKKDGATPTIPEKNK